MPAASNRKTANRSSSRGRESTQTARRSSATRSSSQRPAQRKSSTGTRSKGSNAARSKATNGNRTQTNHQSGPDHIGREALTAVIGATVGVAGGVLLGRTALARERKVLGVPMPKKIDLAGVGQQIGEAGRQFGRLAGEVRGVREKAEQIGRVLS